MQELNKYKVLFNVFNLNKNKTINPVLINHNDPKECKDVSFLLRTSSNHNNCYPCLKFCVSFRTEDALNKHLDLCNTQKQIGRRIFHKDDYLKFDKFHYKIRVPFAIYYDFECIIKDSKHLPIACDLYIKNDYPDILEDKYENYCEEDNTDRFLERADYYNKFFKDVLSINIPLKEDTITPLTIDPQSGFADCFYCRENLGIDPGTGFADIARDHDHLSGKFGEYAHNKCNLQAKNNFVPMYAFNSSN